MRRSWVDLARGALILLALVPLLPPLAGEAPPTWAMGDVAPRAVVAEFDFPVLRDRSEFEEELRRIRGEIPAILVPVDTARSGTERRVVELRSKVETLRATTEAGGPDSLALGFDVETRSALLLDESGPQLLDLLDDLHAEVERRGYVSRELGQELEPFRHVTILRAEGPTNVSRRSLLTPSALRDSAAVAARQRRVPAGPILALVQAVLSPNLNWERAETERLLDRAEEGIPRHRRFVRRGEKIVGANEVVTGDVALALESYSFWWGTDRRPEDDPSGFVDRLARLFLAAIAVGLVFAGLPRQLTTAGGRPSERSLFALWVAFGLLLSAAVVRAGGLSPYLVPASGVALGVALSSGRSAGLLAGVLFCTVAALPGGLGFPAWAVLVAGTWAAAESRAHGPGSLFRIALRSGFLQSLVLLALIGAGVAARRTWSQDLLAVFAGPFLGVALAWAGAATAERLTRRATHLGLAELTSLDHPLLARLLSEAPGTHTHSVRVATLAADAARAIGADDRLARAVGYYHDVGKLARPGDFIENGGGVRSAEQDRLLLDLHIREGVARAEEARLPREIVSGIAEHHGLEAGSEARRPTSRESALVLLANRVERLERNGETADAARVTEVFRASIAAGELDSSGLSIGDVALVRARFVELLGKWGPNGERGRSAAADGGLNPVAEAGEGA